MREYQRPPDTNLDLLGANRVRLPRERELAELQADIVRTAYIEGTIALSPTLTGEYYLDKYLFETRPSILRRLGRFLGDLLPTEIDRVAAPALGAVAIGTAVSLEVGLPLVIVKLEQSAPSDSLRPDIPVEGELYVGELIALIEDVVVTGKRALSAVDAIETAGGHVAHVIAVVDRQQGAADALMTRNIELRALFTPADLGLTSYAGRV